MKIFTERLTVHRVTPAHLSYGALAQGGAGVWHARTGVMKAA